MVRDTPPSQDASTHQIWNSYLKEYRRYGPDTKARRTDGLTDGQTDGRTVRLLYASQSSFGGIKSAQMSVVTFILIYNGMRTVRNYDTPQCPGLTDLAINDHV